MISRRSLAYSSMVRRASSKRDGLGGLSSSGGASAIGFIAPRSIAEREATIDPNQKVEAFLRRVSSQDPGL